MLSRLLRRTGVPNNTKALVAPHFDAAFYRAANPGITGTDEELLTHFMTFGWKEGRDPQAGFSLRDYLEANPDLGGWGDNPLLHYLLHGRAEGRRTLSPERAARLALEQAAGKVAPFFDAEFYRAQNPDVPGDDQELLDHYLNLGWKQDRDPAPGFSTRFYLDSNPDVREDGVNPFVHYILRGAAEGREPKAEVVVLNQFGARASTPDDLALMRPYFDATFYRAANPDVAGSDEDLLEHFLSVGWIEFRDPRPDFSVRYYLTAYPDIAEGKQNPALHFLLHGRREGRRTIATGPMKLVKQDGAVTVAPHLQAVTMRPGEVQPIAPKRVDPAAMIIHWIVPDFSRGSGGHMTIFRMVRLMEEAGHRCKIWIERPSHNKTANDAYFELVKHFQCVEAEIDFLANGFFEARGDVLIATGWSTAYVAARATGFAEKFYFVQDHEPEFYPTGTERKLALASYGLDLACICASPWLQQLMSGTYGGWARHFHLAYDHDIYRLADPDAPERRAAEGPVKIAVYARDHTARRCVQLVLMALDELGARQAPIEVHFFGQKDLPFYIAGYAAFNHGVLDREELAALYADCDIGICFSATNYSLVPQEMMACGLPVVELDVESTRATFPEGVVTFAGPDPMDITAKLQHLIADPAARRAQAEKALAWVANFSWEGAAEAVLAAIRERLGTRVLTVPFLAPSVEPVMDVVIPTYNGITEIKPVIAALRRQRQQGVQIFCIDSSSDDGTQEWLRAQPDVSLTVIAKQDFQHGRTRNEGAALGRAPLIAMLTQDATPAGDNWAGDIRKMFGHFPEAAGLFGRHLPYPDHPQYVREEITAAFQNLLRHPLALSKDTDPALWESGDQGWRQLLHFYSDNNSAMRRRVWQEIPYPEIAYGEDQVWANRIILAGYTKLYAPTATVYHSHDYGPEETFERSRTEGGFFFAQFGYRLGDGSEEQLAKRIEIEQEAFRRHAALTGMPTDEVALRLANIAAKHRGWRAGLTSLTPAKELKKPGQP